MESLHLNAEWLRQKYENEGLSTYDIGRLVGRDSKCVYSQLRRFGIPTRPRGQNLKGGDNYFQATGLVAFKGRQHTEATKALLRAKASVPKPYIRGTRNGMASRVGRLNPNYKTGATPERQHVYASWRWREVRQYVLERDGHKCVRCGAVRTTVKSIHTHHIRSFKATPALRLDHENIVTLCSRCHGWVHSRANADSAFMLP